MTDAASPSSAASEALPGGSARADLREAHERVREAESRIDERGEPSVEATADAYRRAHRLLDRYEDSATGTGDFGAYLRFQDAFIGLVEEFDRDVLVPDAFERASDRMDKRRLNESDFAFAREAIEPAAEAVELLEERDAAREAYRAARNDAKERLRELRADAERLERLVALGEADLDVPIDRLRGPIAAYDDAVSEAFDRFYGERSARELFALLEAGADRPLVDVDRPPRDLANYVGSAPAGEEPLSTLVEYADYSPSKLDHYVDDPGALRTNVAVHRTYLDRLGPEPFLVGWPPDDAATLRARLRELAPLVRRLDAAGDSDVEARRRELGRLTRDPDYERLRRAAIADAELDDEEFRRVASGEAAEELAAVREGIGALEAALDEYALD